MYHNYYSNNELLGNSLRLEIVAGEPVRHVDVVLYVQRAQSLLQLLYNYSYGQLDRARKSVVLSIISYQGGHPFAFLKS